MNPVRFCVRSRDARIVAITWVRASYDTTAAAAAATLTVRTLACQLCDAVTDGAVGTFSGRSRGTDCVLRARKKPVPKRPVRVELIPCTHISHRT